MSLGTHVLSSWGKAVLISVSCMCIAYSKPDPDYPNTHEFMLDNGLKLIIREDHRAPVVTAMIWYKIGSVDEPRGLGGISHMLEHMMFKGTKTLKANEYSTIITNLGGRYNAFTSSDYTAYYATLPAWELETSLRLDADRMRHLVLRDEDFAPERLVVAEERRQRTDSNPQALFYEAFSATAWTTSAYRNPIIGWMPEIHKWTLDDLKTWYARYYAPNNATIVIVGDVNVSQAYELTKQYFGAFPKNETLTYLNDFEIPQKGEKRLNLSTRANLPMLLMGYKVPSINTAQDKNDVYALILAAELLSGSQTARLPKKLVKEQQIALQTYSNYSDDNRYEALFMFMAIPAKTTELTTLELLIKKEIEQLKTELVTKEELDKILTAYKASKIYEQDSIYYQAMLIGSAEISGEGWKQREQLLSNLEKVTPEMIRTVCQKYLTDETLTVGMLHATTSATTTPKEENR